MQDQEWRRTAWVVSVLINNHKNWKKPNVTIDTLLGKDSESDYTDWVRKQMLKGDDWKKKNYQPED
ncbi:hypothetical protein [Chondrinema litorale]|uniref:hypothetical protein n=1 Tax=Chondrinema litorale TaxID=2994555 RepID=UPI0025427E26|nr:hypothetical protein [Chondrinema litorale]UZS00269.1 hypothetical protein OQ292_40725 [Chondrinema litorale]